jgi:hypothetical protein
MIVRYSHLRPEKTPPALTSGPFCAVIITDVCVSEVWRERTTEWLVQNGCLYAVAWGVDCEEWHDSVDSANLSEFEYGDYPDERFVMTTWHAKDPLSEAFWFAGQCVFHPTVELTETIIVHVSNESREAEMLQIFADSQTPPHDD